MCKLELCDQLVETLKLRVIQFVDCIVEWHLNIWYKFEMLKTLVASCLNLHFHSFRSDVYISAFYIRCPAAAKQAILPKGDSGLHSSCAVCTAGIGHLHVECFTTWTDPHQISSVSGSWCLIVYVLTYHIHFNKFTYLLFSWVEDFVLFKFMFWHPLASFL